MESKPRGAFQAGAVIVGLVLLWLFAGLFLTPASAGAGGISMDIRSRIRADYGPSENGSGIQRILFSIGQEALRIAGLSESEAQARMRAYTESLLTPVATATARDFSGAAPFTPTSTQTARPSNTPTSTLTSTPTDPPTELPTLTPTRTQTPRPTATKTPAGPVDTEMPSILNISFSPSPGSLNACVFDVDEMHVFDPAFSSGISNPVYARVTYPDSYQGYFELDLDSGGFVAGPGSDWDAYYADSVDFKDPAHPVVAGDEIDVELKVQDDEGTGWVVSSIYIYTLTVDCP